MITYTTKNEIIQFQRAKYFITTSDIPFMFALLYKKNKRIPDGIYAQQGNEPFMLACSIKQAKTRFGFIEEDMLKNFEIEIRQMVKSWDQPLRNYNSFLVNKGGVQVAN